MRQRVQKLRISPYFRAYLTVLRLTKPADGRCVHAMLHPQTTESAGGLLNRQAATVECLGNKDTEE